MAVNLSPIGGVAGQFFDNNGNPLTGGKIFTFAAGTTTPQATYTSAGGATPHANPIILDAAGRVPGGEIWLTDGLQYKFVIKTSTDVQIGSYDNIIGINSNFVNYTNSQEIQTATAGQTVFTLTTMQYQPGTNSLSVFVDGVNQYGPGNLYAYEETSATVVTFASGLHVGAEVKFTTSAINASSYGDAEQISYTAPYTSSVTTNVELKLAETVSVKDFGAVGDGVADDTAAIQAAINSFKTNGIPILLNGNFRITAPLVYQTQGSSSGLQIVGTGIYDSSIIADFTGTTAFDIDGSSLQKNSFQYGGGFRDFQITTALGAAVENAITCNGWWFATHSNLLIGNFGSASFTKNGIYIPLRTDIDANPDAYASVNWALNSVQIDFMGEYGVYGANNTGYANWVINGGRFERNGLDGLYVNTNGWRVTNAAIAANGRYGINYTGSASITLTNGFFSQCELDGNATAGIRISRVNSGVFQNMRLISRVLNTVETQLTHVLGDNANVILAVEMANFYHRIETGITSAVTLYNFGSASSNVQGNAITGYSLLNSAGVTVTEQSAALLDRRYKNYVSNSLGAEQTASPAKFAWSSESNQAITNTLSTWIFDQNVSATGWTDYNTTTGVLTAPHNGFYFFNINFNLTSVPAGERIVVNLVRAGSVIRTWYWDWPSGVGADRWAFTASDLVTVNASQQLLIEVQATVASSTLFGNAKLDIFAV
jgi:hypothetical protein